MAEDEKLGLRERKKRDTRWALSDAALELMFERGLENVVREDIAARAGVSVRTFNNYFAGKYEALAYRMLSRLQQTVAVLKERPAAEPLWTALTIAFTEPYKLNGVTFPTPTLSQLAEIRKLANLPELRAVLSGDIHDELLLVLARRTGTDPDSDLYPRLLTSSLVGLYSTAMYVYLHADPPRPIVPLIEEAMAAIAAGLPDPSKR
ncbi:TetR family transcriptional regulator [Nocardia panacis]|uniref:TetR family transcriptional regulator n=1 Tax=Nocardia panacis TaxID=2340916 RepID=A0A3A4K2H5_9NOCA|nr:TetR/AcrR family transcriptional regulator [Nocardia panacis]RJO68176.1 TetR family transcriptional regulator [Nocardia panacis]